MEMTTNLHYASTCCCFVKESPEVNSTGNVNFCCALFLRLPYIQRESEKATGRKAGGDLQLCPKTIYSDVMGEGRRKESAR